MIPLCVFSLLLQNFYRDVFYRDVYLLYMWYHNETCITHFVLQYLMIVQTMTVKLSVACVWVIYSYVSMVFHSKFAF